MDDLYDYLSHNRKRLSPVRQPSQVIEGATHIVATSVPGLKWETTKEDGGYTIRVIHAKSGKLLWTTNVDRIPKEKLDTSIKALARIWRESGVDWDVDEKELSSTKGLGSVVAGIQASADRQKNPITHNDPNEPLLGKLVYFEARKPTMDRNAVFERMDEARVGKPRVAKGFQAFMESDQSTGTMKPSPATCKCGHKFTTTHMPMNKNLKCPKCGADHKSISQDTGLKSKEIPWKQAMGVKKESGSGDYEPGCSKCGKQAGVKDGQCKDCRDIASLDDNEIMGYDNTTDLKAEGVNLESAQTEVWGGKSWATQQADDKKKADKKDSLNAEVSELLSKVSSDVQNKGPKSYNAYKTLSDYKGGSSSGIRAAIKHLKSVMEGADLGSRNAQRDIAQSLLARNTHFKKATDFDSAYRAYLQSVVDEDGAKREKLLKTSGSIAQGAIRAQGDFDKASGSRKESYAKPAKMAEEILKNTECKSCGWKGDVSSENKWGLMNVKCPKCGKEDLYGQGSKSLKGENYAKPAKIAEPPAKDSDDLHTADGVDKHPETPDKEGQEADPLYKQGANESEGIIKRAPDGKFGSGPNAGMPKPKGKRGLHGRAAQKALFKKVGKISKQQGLPEDHNPEEYDVDPEDQKDYDESGLSPREYYAQKGKTHPSEKGKKDGEKATMKQYKDAKMGSPEAKAAREKLLGKPGKSKPSATPKHFMKRSENSDDKWKGKFHADDDDDVNNFANQDDEEEYDKKLRAQKKAGGSGKKLKMRTGFENTYRQKQNTYLYESMGNQRNEGS